MENGALAERLQDRIMMIILKQDHKGLDLEWTKAKINAVLSDYCIEPKQESLIVYTEGKNEAYLRRFLMAKAVKGCTLRTLELYEFENRSALRIIGKDVDTITSQDIELLMAKKLASGASKRRCNNIWHCLSSFFNWLYREELIRTNPISKVEPMKFRAKKEKALTDMEIELIRQQCASSMQRAIVEVLLSTGCRVTELASIKIQDLDEDKVEIIGKGEKARTVYLNAKAVVALRQYLSERKDANPYLFPGCVPPKNLVKKNVGPMEMCLWFQNPKNVVENEPLNTCTIDAILRKLGKKAGVDGVHTHRFRRTCATQALRHGMPIEYVSLMLGHESISTTQIYLDLREDDLKAAHRKYVV